MVAGESFEIGGGELDEGLEKVSLFGVVADCMPKSFEDFVAFPPVGIVVEVDPIQIFRRGLPVGSREWHWVRLWLTIGMTKRAPSWMWCLAWYETIGGERVWRVAGPVGVRRFRFSHRKIQRYDRILETPFGLPIAWL